MSSKLQTWTEVYMCSSERYYLTLCWTSRCVFSRSFLLEAQSDDSWESCTQILLIFNSNIQKTLCVHVKRLSCVHMNIWCVYVWPVRPSSSYSVLDLSANRIPDGKTCTERENTRRPEEKKMILVILQDVIVFTNSVFWLTAHRIQNIQLLLDLEIIQLQEKKKNNTFLSGESGSG